MSRTDLDFESALRADGTVLLSEGLDVNTLGLDTSPSPGAYNTSFGSPTPPPRHQPNTPTVVPPTPSPVAGPSTTRTAAKQIPPSPSLSSSNDPFYDSEDNNPERQTNRRSMYRSPGTSSSPDLATLLRKAKERGGVIGTSGNNKKELKRRESPPPLPDRTTNGTRQRSSTAYASASSSPQANSSSKANKLQRAQHSDANSDWVLTGNSPRPPTENGTLKVRA